MFKEYIILTKPYIVVLLLLTALSGIFVSVDYFPSVEIVGIVLIGGALTASGANAINHYMDRDIDSMMSRTTLRPVPRGAISPTRALIVGVLLNILGFAVLSIGANIQSAVLAAIASLFYILVYTAWLKRTTSQNIVIGGAAGAMPPLVAAAAVTGGVPMAAVYLFLIIFLWTPPHFWALALLIKDDYARAKVPMLPVVKGERTTYWNIFIYTIVLAVVNALFVMTSDIGLIYLIVGICLSAMFIYLAVRLLREASQHAALVLYKYSLLYLSGLCLAVIVDRVVTF